MRSNNPIGVFDSGVGGLSVWRELVKLMPHEDTIYFADNANCPYGEKEPHEIINLSKSIAEFLISKQCKIIVVACNTATAAAIDYLRQHYPTTFIGMEPAVKPAALSSQTGVVGILATAGTLKGRLFNETKKRFASSTTVVETVGTGLVEMVENGDLDSKETEELLKKYIQPMLEQHIDHLVLGCTHYPFLAPTIKKIVGDTVSIIDPAPAVAYHTQELLAQAELLNKTGNFPTYSFYTSGQGVPLQKMLKMMGLKDATIQENAHI